MGGGWRVEGGRGGWGEGAANRKKGPRGKKSFYRADRMQNMQVSYLAPSCPKWQGKRGWRGGGSTLRGEEKGGVNSEGYRLEKSEGWNVDKG